MLSLIPWLLFCAAQMVVAAPIQRRAIIHGDHYIPLGNTTVPLTPLLLVFAALAVAAVGMLLILFRLFVPSCMSSGSRIILEEREQAKQDLRVRGGCARHNPSSSPRLHTTRHFSNKPPRRVGHNSLSSVPSEVPTLSDRRPNQHGYRGTSFSLAEARKYSDKSRRSSLSAPGLSLLASNDSSSSGSSSPHLGAGGMSERARSPLSTRNNVIGLAYSTHSKSAVFPPLLHRNSSVGKGADLQRTRSGPLESRIPLKPQSIDPAYSQQRSHSFHPLHSTRRDSTLSIYEVPSSAEHSSNSAHDSSSGNSRVGSFSMATASPLQPLLHGHSHSQPSDYASPPAPLHPSRSYSLTSAAAINAYHDSDESTPNSRCASPRLIHAGSPTASTTLLVPSRLSSHTQKQ